MLAAALPRLILVMFEGAQTLDVTGPAEVFAQASRRRGRPLYEVIVASTGGGPRRFSSGLSVDTRPLRGLTPRDTDTILVSGGDDAALRAALDDGPLLRWLDRASRVVRRLGSVCSGAFVLAGAGLLDGKRAATHWSACELLRSYRPAIQVDPEAIFVQDGSLWTSAGVTTGIDMALAMVEQDHGRELADRIAAQLVLYARRPGFQAQFSGALVAQLATSDPLGALIERARTQLRRLDVGRLARLAALSPRTLHRRCLLHLRLTPAKLIERLRVEHARTLLTTTDRSAKTIAIDSGFGGAERMRRAFERELGVSPQQVRLLFGRAPSGSSGQPRAG